MDVRLVQFSAYGHEVFPMAERECVIGREPSCHLRPDHGRVSKRHCRLYWHGIRLFVEDINSADGTLVNGERIHVPTELHDGDELCAGPVHYLVMIADADEMARRDPSWVAQAIRACRGLQPALSPSDSNIPVSPAMQTARSILDRLAHDHEHEREPEVAPRHGLEVEDQDGIALACILDRDLIDETDIRRVAHQLEELILAGKVRIALDFRNVEHCSSQALSTLLRAYERCRTGGGALKVCTVQPAVAQLFFMTDLHKHIEIFPESRPALESVWPRRPGGDEAAEASDEAARPRRGAPGGSAEESAAGDPWVRLIVAVGKARGRAIEVKGRRFVIGRDARCQLRPNSETVSRIHAIIERREGKVFVRDYGTKNGTILAGRTLRGEEAEAHDGDSLQVGVLGFSLQILPTAHLNGPSEDEILSSWLTDQASSANPDAPTALLIPTQPQAGAARQDPTGTPPAAADEPDDEAAASHADPGLSTNALACEVVRGVLVARIRASSLDDEATVGPLRYDLQNFFDRPLPRRVVLSLEDVNYLSSRAVGVLLAFFQHLDREHGAMRVCCVSPKVLPVLDSMRLPKLVDLYASVEEAVSDPWL